MKLIDGGGETSEVKKVPLKIIKGGKGMINLSNKIFKDEVFKTAFMKLYQSEMSHKAFYTVEKAMQKFEQRGREVLDEDKKIKDTYLITEIVKKEGEPDTTKYSWVDEKAAEAAFKALYESAFDIEVGKLFAADLSHLRFTPSEWAALSPFMHDPSNAESPKTPA